MEKRVTKIYFTILFIGILYAVFASVSSQNKINARSGDKVVAKWDNDMEIEREGDTYCYSRILPSENMEEKVIIYNTVHMYLEVFIDGNKVYELKPGQGSIVKTTGFCWNKISLKEEDAGKEILFRVTPVYDDSKPKGNFFYGTYQEIENQILRERIFRLAVAVSIALAGFVMLFYGLLVVKKGHNVKVLMQFAIFAIMLGVWSVGETQILDWIFPCSIVIVFISHLMLMAMPLPFILFIRYMYHNKESKLWDFCCYVNCAVIALRVALQVTGIYELRETLMLTHIYLLFFVVVIVIMTVHEMLSHNFTRQVRINTICVTVILISTVLELAIFRFGNKSTPIGSIGFLIYTIVMGVENVRRTRELIEQARESELYRKLAFTDELTGLPNRTAFREDLDKRMKPDKVTGEGKILPTVVFMFDLNDLKKCNDTYGHDYGDQYIKMAADTLKKAFAKEGKCYRIGGDEFCAWAPYTSSEEINQKLAFLEQEVRGLNDKGFVVTVAIAVGYATYDEGEDGSGLYSTMKRADAMMYERKQEYKKRQAKRYQYRLEHKNDKYVKI